MSCIKRSLESEIFTLSLETGYSYDFLMQMWDELCEDGDADFEYFRGVTMEHDW